MSGAEDPNLIPERSAFGRVYLERNRTPEEARTAYWAAFNLVLDSAPSGSSAEDVTRYLASRYGEATAREALNGRPVAAQLSFRRARFLKHFEEVRRTGGKP